MRGNPQSAEEGGREAGGVYALGSAKRGSLSVTGFRLTLAINRHTPRHAGVLRTGVGSCAHSVGLGAGPGPGFKGRGPIQCTPLPGWARFGEYSLCRARYEPDRSTKTVCLIFRSLSQGEVFSRVKALVTRSQLSPRPLPGDALGRAPLSSD